MRIKLTLAVCLLSLVVSGSVAVAEGPVPSNDSPSAPGVTPGKPPASGYFAPYSGVATTPRAKRGNITSMAESDPIQAGDCWYTQAVDNAHISSDPPTAASSHGWWNRVYISNCPVYANVDTYLEAWWCDGWGCRWITVASNTDDVREGGGSGNRVTARWSCSGTDLVGWRSFVDVDLIGVWDPPGYTYSDPVNLYCVP